MGKPISSSSHSTPPILSTLTFTYNLVLAKSIYCVEFPAILNLIELYPC